MPARMKRKEFLERANELAEALRLRIREGAAGKPFEDTSAAAKAERRRRALADPEFFFRTYMPHYMTHETPAFHYVIDKLAERQDRMTILMAPRGYAKTTRRITLHSTRKLCLKLRRNSLIISDTVDKAAMHLLPIKTEFEVNERIRCDFGDLRGSTWTDTELITTDGIRIAACSWRQNIRGEIYLSQRPDEAIIDDLESKQSAIEPTQVEKRLNFVREDLVPALIPEGWIVTWMGTPLDEECAIVRAKNLKDEHGKPIFETHEIKEFTGGKPTWPDRFPARVLKKKRRDMGSAAYLQEYSLLPPNKLSFFRREWFRNNYYDLRELDTSELLIIRAVDPSQGIKDLAAILTVGADTATMDCYFLQVVLRKLSPLELIEECVRLDKIMPAQVNLIEGNLYRDLLAPIINKLRPGLAFQQVINTQNKLLRIRTQSGWVEMGRYHLDPNVGDSQELEDEYVYVGKTGVFDDGPDAGELIYGWLRQVEDKSEYRSVRKREFEEALRGYV